MVAARTRDVVEIGDGRQKRLPLNYSLQQSISTGL